MVLPSYVGLLTTLLYGAYGGKTIDGNVIFKGNIDNTLIQEGQELSTVNPTKEEDDTHCSVNQNHPGMITDYEDDYYEEEQDYLPDYNWDKDLYQSRSYIHHRLYNDVYEPGFVMTIPELCHDNPDTIVMINTAPHHEQHRIAIRKGYKKKLRDSGVAVAFVIGTPCQQSVLTRLREEHILHQDVIVTRAKASYENITLKVGLMMEWTLENCPSAKYMAKVDDDVLLNVKEFLRLLKIPRENTIMGKVCATCIPFDVPGHNYLVTRHHLALNKYPAFTMGPAYVVTTDFLPFILDIVNDEEFLPYYEDVFWTGLAVEALNMEEKPEIDGRIMLKYTSLSNSRPRYNVTREDIPNWRMNHRGKTNAYKEVLSEDFTNAITVHPIDWNRDSGFVKVLQSKWDHIGWTLYL